MNLNRIPDRTEISRDEFVMRSQRGLSTILVKLGQAVNTSHTSVYVQTLYCTAVPVTLYLVLYSGVPVLITSVCALLIGTYEYCTREPFKKKVERRLEAPNRIPDRMEISRNDYVVRSYSVGDSINHFVEAGPGCKHHTSCTSVYVQTLFSVYATLHQCVRANVVRPVLVKPFKKKAPGIILERHVEGTRTYSYRNRLGQIQVYRYYSLRGTAEYINNIPSMCKHTKYKY